MSKFHEMQAEVEAARGVGSQPGRATIYMVAAWDKQYKKWAIPSTTNRAGYTDRDAAEKAADGLSSMWHHARIIKIDLGPLEDAP